jgi:PAS domain-containing protein
MKGTRFLSRLTGFMRGKRRFLSDPSLILLGLAGFDGKLKFLNPAWEKILGYPPQALLDRPLCELTQQHGQAPPPSRWWTGSWPRTASTQWNSACDAKTAHANGSYGTDGLIRSTRRSSPSRRAGKLHRCYDPMNNRNELTLRFKPGKVGGTMNFARPWWSERPNRRV